MDEGLKMSRSVDEECVMRLPVRARDAASWYSLFRNKLYEKIERVC